MGWQAARTCAGDTRALGICVKDLHTLGVRQGNSPSQKDCCEFLGNQPSRKLQSRCQHVEIRIQLFLQQAVFASSRVRNRSQISKKSCYTVVNSFILCVREGACKYMNRTVGRLLDQYEHQCGETGYVVWHQVWRIMVVLVLWKKIICDKKMNSRVDSE